MAAPAWATNMTTFHLDGATTVTAIGTGGAGLGNPETDFYIQGSNCVSKAAWTNATKGFIIDALGTTFTVPTDGAIIGWAKYDAQASLDLKANGGLQMIVGSASGAYYHYYIGGNDNLALRTWYPYAIDPNTATVDNTTGSPDGNERWVGLLATLPTTSGPNKGNPIAMDAIRYGRCDVEYTDGDVGNGYNTFSGAETFGNDPSRRWGLLELIDGSYQMQGFHSFGTSGTAVDFRDSNKAIFIRDNGDNNETNDAVSTAFNRLEILNASSNVEWNNISFTALGTRARGVFVHTAGTFAATACQFVGMDTFSLLAGSTMNDCIFRGCNAITAPGSDMVGSQVLVPTVAADASALVWNVATNPNGLLDDMTFSKGTNAHHAIEFGLSSPTSITLNNVDFLNFNASNAQNDSTFNILRTSGTVTINIVGGSGNVSYKTAGATVNVVQNPVTTQVTVRDENSALLSGARVYLRASSGTGDLPYQDSISITGTGTTATVTHTAHGLATNDWVSITGCYESEYNGTFQVTVTGTDTYTYTTSTTISSSPATDARRIPKIESKTVTIEGASVTSATFNMPATRPDGDLYLLFVSKDDQFGCSELNSVHGWTNIQQGDGTANEYVNGSAWYKIGSSEPASYTFNFDSSDLETAIFVVYRISGQAPSSFINVSSLNEMGPTLTPTATAVTTTEPSCLVFAMSAGSDALDIYPLQHLYTSQPDRSSGWSVSANHGSFEAGTAGACSIAISTKVQDAPGTTGTANFTFNGNNVAEEHVGIQVAIAGTVLGPQATGVVINESTTGTGLVSDTRTWSNNQPVVGYVRKGTSAPYYIEASLSGTISSSLGLSIEIKMVRDD